MSFYRRRPIYYQRGGGIGLGFLRNIFTKNNIKKGAQKLLEFGSDVLKQHNQNPNTGLLDATKKVARQKVTNSLKNVFQNHPKSINTGNAKKPVTKSRKRKRDGAKSLSNKKLKSTRKITL